MVRRLGERGYILRRLGFSFKIRTIIFSVCLISIKNLVPIQTSISSSTFIKVPMRIVSIAAFVLFQRSILPAWKKLNSFQLFHSLAWLQVWNLKLAQSNFLKHNFSCKNLWPKMPCLGTFGVADLRKLLSCLKVAL